MEQPSAAGQQRSDTYRELKCPLLSAPGADINCQFWKGD